MWPSSVFSFVLMDTEEEGRKRRFVLLARIQLKQQRFPGDELRSVASLSCVTFCYAEINKGSLLTVWFYFTQSQTISKLITQYMSSTS